MVLLHGLQENQKFHEDLRVQYPYQVLTPLLFLYYGPHESLLKGLMVGRHRATIAKHSKPFAKIGSQGLIVKLIGQVSRQKNDSPRIAFDESEYLSLNPPPSLP